MTYALGPTSLNRLEGVDPRLVECVKLAITLIDFMVLCGVRSQREQWTLYAKGRTRAELNAKGCPADIVAQPTQKKVTWVTRSNHTSGKAVDLGVYPYDPNAPIALYVKIKEAMFKAAKKVGVKLRWGGDWDQDGITEHGENDFGHFEVIS